ncbi:ash family protein [Vibrio fluvialis]|nr:ash family protein [Vibrio fluvialis]MBY7775244.1 ash family protein [Vibrio fluvialis]MBY7779592.1 ash family protein [Vibrio fluvialis]MBY7993175.1 ash family protein [Vibrio fluvialis]
MTPHPRRPYPIAVLAKSSTGIGTPLNYSRHISASVCWFFLCAASAHLNIGVTYRERTISIMVGWAGALRRAVSLSTVVPTLSSSPPIDWNL